MPSNEVEVVIPKAAAEFCFPGSSVEADPVGLAAVGVTVVREVDVFSEL